MSGLARVGTRAIVVLGVLAATGCATYPTRTVDSENVVLQRTSVDWPDAELLDVRVEIFDPGTLPASEDEARGLSETIRKAEAHYIPVQLANTMQRTGYWGAVRVVPAGTAGSEVTIRGGILQSDGEILKLAVTAHNATGQRWFDRTYESVVDAGAYTPSASGRAEPFQNLYNRIANDLAEFRERLPPGEVATIRQVAELRFAANFAPSVFGGYLKTDQDGQSGPAGLLALLSAKPAGSEAPRFRIVRLPARDDEMLARVRRIRAREYMLVDTLDAQYGSVYREMRDEYATWRESRLTEINMIREVDAQTNKEIASGVAIAVLAIGLGAAISNSDSSNSNYGSSVGAGVAAVGTAIAVQRVERAAQTREQIGLNLAAMVETGESFSNAMEPMVVEIEGETVELTGTAEAKYQQWREVLHRLHEREVGPTGGEAPKTGTNPA
jgi:hypothetical protein